MSSQKHLVLLYISTNKNNNAREALNKLVKGFSSNKYLSKALYDIAVKYEDSGKYEDSEGTYQQVIQLSSNSFRADKAHLDIPKCKILSLVDAGEHSKVHPEIDKLIADFGNNPYLPVAISRIAVQYQNNALKAESQGLANKARDYQQKATAIWERVIKEFPESTTLANVSGRLGECETVTPKAYSSLGDYCHRLGEYEKSSQYYQKIVDDYPDFVTAWHARFMLGRNYEKMYKSGLISKSKAHSKINNTYQKLLEEYPDCKAAKAARRWLTQYNWK